jgi:hypothetical protein
MTLVDQVVAFGPADSVDIAKIEKKPWSHKAIPPQVQLVELLQFMQFPPFEKRRRRVAVLVSAWDLIAEPRPEPKVWLEREMPLLGQYLQTNQDSFESRIYGVSALGGNIENTEMRDKLIGMTHSERVLCAGPECTTHDLTAPIVWLTSEG